MHWLLYCSPGEAREAPMGQFIRHITYKGKDIIFMDAKGANEEEGIAAWEEMRQELLRLPGAHLTLIDATDIALTPAVLRKAKESTRRKADPGTRTVFVGMNSIQRTTAELVARGMHLNVHFCATLDEGKEWLVQEDDKHGRT